MAPPSRARLLGLLVVIALSTPLALALETVLRRWIMPPEFEQIRRWLSPSLAPWAWGTVPAAVVATALGWGLLRVLARRELRQRRPGQTEAQARARAEFEALMLASSAPQVPAIAATVLYMLGAPLRPVVVSMAVATLGVFSLALALARPVDRDQGPPDAAA